MKIIAILVSGVLGYYILSCLRHHTNLSDPSFFLGLVLPVFLLGLGLAFMVTGYSVDAGGILIRRLFWRRRISRDDIAQVSLPSALSGRHFGLFGVWGFCGKSGIAYSGSLGLHIVAASADAPRVIIRRHRGMPVVISPSDTQAFIEAFHHAATHAT